MRSTVFSISNRCPKQNECRFCIDLGYRSRRPLDLSNAESKIKSHLGSVAETVVLPCSSIQNKFYKEITEAIRFNGLKIKHIFWNELWDSLPQEQKSNLDPGDVAIFFTNLEDICKFDYPKEIQKYFLVLKNNWDRNKWQLLPTNLKSELRLFFPPNLQNKKEYFTAHEVYDLFEEIALQDPQAKFETPFGSDLKDGRNEDHLGWHFYSEPKWKRLDEIQPEISVIIPTYNRDFFLNRVIHSLGKQTLLGQKFEVLVLDDGGNDSTEEHLKETLKVFPRLNVSYFYIPRNLALTGLYIGNRAGPIRNLGAKVARGKYLLFLDSDILLPQDYLLKAIRLHDSADVLLPRRVYLSTGATSKAFSGANEFGPDEIMITPWQFYLDSFYASGDWQNQEVPWKYFMTYCLSLPRELFFKSGGFRTNYISYGYEDLDFGFRTMQLKPILKLINEDVFHLNHFEEKSSEYGLSPNFRKLQLAMTSRMFVFQNIPLKFPYLREMIKITNLKQWIFYYWFTWLWKMRAFGKKIYRD